MSKKQPRDLSNPCNSVLNTVDWNVWKSKPKAALWEVVAVSLNIEPSLLTEPFNPGLMADEFDPNCTEFLKYSRPNQFLKRLSIAEANLEEGLRAVAIVETKRRKFHSIVRLADFAEWFMGMNPPLKPPLPKKFPKPLSRKSEAEAGDTWPWGSYETKLLTELAAAVKQFWKSYDPAIPASAPTNQKVVNWLKGQKVSARNAEVIAKIIRADNAPRGPRPRVDEK